MIVFSFCVGRHGQRMRLAVGSLLRTTHNHRKLRHDRSCQTGTLTVRALG